MKRLSYIILSWLQKNYLKSSAEAHIVMNIFLYILLDTCGQVSYSGRSTRVRISRSLCQTVLIEVYKRLTWFQQNESHTSQKGCHQRGQAAILFSNTVLQIRQQMKNLRKQMFITVSALFFEYTGIYSLSTLIRKYVCISFFSLQRNFLYSLSK